LFRRRTTSSRPSAGVVEFLEAVKGSGRTWWSASPGRDREQDPSPHEEAWARSLDEVIRWQTDDLWFSSLEALVAYVRAAADRTGRPVGVVCERIAARHGVELGTPAE
jgi:hypothetical protein